MPNGPACSVVFRNVKLDGISLVTKWKIDGGAWPASKIVGVCTTRKTLFSSHVIDDTIEVSVAYFVMEQARLTVMIIIYSRWFGDFSFPTTIRGHLRGGSITKPRNQLLAL